ncbi:MAG: endonuclease/exonuclease/phosphatase family protein [Sphingobacteriales bacterium]
MLQSDHLKIVTINTWKCDGNYTLRMRLLAGQLKDLKPDIIACQECFYSDEGNADTLKFLAGQLKMKHCFLPGRLKKRLLEGKWVESFSGLGILSAYPIAFVNQFDLPAVPEDNDRKVQQAVICLPAGENILVTNTHLTHLQYPIGLRKIQAEALAGLVSADKDFRYHVICGDFNATSSSPEIETFINLTGAIDTYKAGKGAEPRYSLAGAYADNKLIGVDHIFALQAPGNGTYPEFINSGVVLNIPDEATGLYPSDHFGISTTMAIS